MSQDIVLGRYRLLRRIAAGGMAEVYLAMRQQPHGVTGQCIVKRILPGLAEREEFARAFIDEARIGAQLAHPNLVSILEFDEIDGTLFLALEYVDGPDLGALLEALARQGTRMPVGVACAVLAQLLRGLAHAHNATDPQGRSLCIVHRDVNPPNILLSRSGAVKLSDFGIAHAASRLTTTRFGLLKGKAPYMSPEQADGRVPDGRSDLFACGAVLYEMLVGGRLFVGNNEMEVLRQVREAEIHPPSRFRDEIDPELDRLCVTALARRPKDRFSSAEAFGEDLERYRAAHYADQGVGQLAELVGRYTPAGEFPEGAPPKTPILKPAPAKAKAAPFAKPGRLLGRPGKRASFLLVLLVLAAATAALYFGLKPPGGATGPIGAKPTARLDVRGAPVAYVMQNDMLLGRSPLEAQIPSGSKAQPVAVHRAGFLSYQRGMTLRARQTRLLDLNKTLRPSLGTLVFDGAMVQEIQIDGVKQAADSDGRIDLPAGLHCVSWSVDGRRHERFVRLAPGREQPLL